MCLPFCCPQVSTDAVNRTFTALIICEKGNEEAAGPVQNNRVFRHLHDTRLFIPEGMRPRNLILVTVRKRQVSLYLSHCSYMCVCVYLGPCSHTVQKLKPQDISAITVKTLKVIPERIIDNYNKRQQPRFRWTSICFASAPIYFTFSNH